MADEVVFQYKYLGGSPKVFSATRNTTGEQRSPNDPDLARLVQPGDQIEAKAPMHHGELEPLNQPAKDFAAANGLALQEHGGELWADRFAADNGMAYEVDSASGKVVWKKASKAKAPADASDVTSAAAPASNAPQEA